MTARVRRKNLLCVQVSQSLPLTPAPLRVSATAGHAFSVKNFSSITPEVAGVVSC